MADSGISGGKNLWINDIHLNSYHVGHGGASVETTAFDRRVVGSNPALASM